MGLADLLTGDNYRDYVLPALGVVEAIATKGRSPGTAAMGQIQAFDKSKDDRETKERQSRLDAQTAAKDALQTRLGGLQIDNAEHEKLNAQKRDASIQALRGKLGDTPEKQAFYDAYPETYAQQLKPEQTQVVIGGDGLYHALGKKDATDAVTHEAITAPPKPVPGAASASKEWNKQSTALNKEYKNAVSSSRSGINLGSADLAFKGIQKTLDSPTITPADVLIIRDQLIKMVNPGYAITSVQFGHSNVGGIVDKLNNILSQASGTQSLTDKQKNEYRGIVSRLGSDLREQHSAIKDYYASRAHDLSQHNNWLDSDSLKVEPMNYSFDATPAAGVTEADINSMNADQLKAFLNGK